jgi:hypothetical protein
MSRIGRRPVSGSAAAAAEGQSDARGRADGGRAERRLRGARRTTLSAAIMLLIQYGLGMGVNLYVTVPASDQHHGLGSALGHSLSNSPVVLAVHSGFGLLLLVAGVNVLVRAIAGRRPVIITSAVIALIAIIGAAVSGARFVDAGDNAAASMMMGILTAVALLCYLVNLYLYPSPSRR